MSEPHPCPICGLRPVVYAAMCAPCRQERKRREAGVPPLNRQTGRTCRDCGERPAVKCGQCHRCYMRAWQQRRAVARKKVLDPLAQRRKICYAQSAMSTETMTIESSAIYTVREAARAAGLRVGAIYEALEADDLRAMPVAGKAKLVLGRDLAEWLERRRAAAGEIPEAS